MISPRTTEDSRHPLSRNKIPQTQSFLGAEHALRRILPAAKKTNGQFEKLRSRPGAALVRRRKGFGKTERRLRWRTAEVRLLQQQVLVVLRGQLDKRHLVLFDAGLGSSGPGVLQFRQRLLVRHLYQEMLQPLQLWRRG